MGNDNDRESEEANKRKTVRVRVRVKTRVEEAHLLRAVEGSIGDSGTVVENVRN